MAEAETIGPLQLIAVVFGTSNFTGAIAEEIKKLSEKEFIRLVDATVVVRYETGEVAMAEASGLTLEEVGDYGSYIGALLGIGTGDENIAQELAAKTRSNFQARYKYGLKQEDIEAIAQTIPNDGAVLMLLIEHRWAIPLRGAMNDAGGLLVAQDFLSPELLISLGREMSEDAASQEKQAEEIAIH
jgi:uncharacterized membrane protein